MTIKLTLTYKTLILDIDTKESVDVNLVIEATHYIEPIGTKCIALIETKNGYHLITKPFNSKVFGEKYPEIEIHKNNPTILYVP